MGQAKKRGNRAARIAEAHARQMNEEPINIPCKTCGEPLNGFTLLHTAPAGAAWQKGCTCGAVTTALVQARHSTLERTTASVLGIAKQLVGENDKRVSVTYFQKTLATVETGIVRL